MKKSIFRRLCKLNRMAAPLAPKGELNRSIRTLGRDGLASDAQGNANTVAHLCMKVKPQSNSVRGSFTAKTLLRGNPAGSVVPFGHAALGISTLSSPRSGLRRPGERKTERAAAKPQGAKRRAAVAVSGEAAERPMEPEAVRASLRVFAVPPIPRTLLARRRGCGNKTAPRECVGPLCLGARCDVKPRGGPEG